MKHKLIVPSPGETFNIFFDPEVQQLTIEPSSNPSSRNDFGPGKSRARNHFVDLRGLFSKLAPQLRRALMVVRTVRLRPSEGRVRDCRKTRQVAQPNDRQLAAVEALYAEGAKLRDLAPELGVSRVRLADLLRQRGVRIRNASPTPDEVTEMAHRYESGESLERIGKRLGFNGGTVRNRLVARGVAMRDSHGRTR